MVSVTSALLSMRPSIGFLLAAFLILATTFQSTSASSIWSRNGKRTDSEASAVPLRSVGDMSRCDSALIGSALAIWAMAATGPVSWNSMMPSLGRLATLGMAKAAASTLTVPAGTFT